ncbi:hypothetical protein Tco_0991767 [Tanacetum coccineum]|uniref:Uncharacterized protein n=1 Tax=Tanacetum coccineum TaxID=301880 RepID=A0ABQ5F0B8_9ASTR
MLFRRIEKANKLRESQNVAAVEKKILMEDVEKLVEGKDESDGDDFANTILLSDEDSGDRIKPKIHKENWRRLLIMMIRKTMMISIMMLRMIRIMMTGTDISQKDEKPSKKRQNRTRDGKVCEDEAQSKSNQLREEKAKKNIT